MVRNRTRVIGLWLGSVLVAVGLSAFTSCAKQSVGQSKPPPEIKTAAEFKPDALYSEAIELVLADTTVPAVLKSKTVGKDIVFEAATHGTVVETEKYRLDDDQFALVELTETYDPPLPLLKFPMAIGDTWRWSGVITIPGRKKATATVTSSLDASAYGTDTVHITVDLRVDTGIKPIDRKLDFWFVKGRGIAQRTYGAVLSRRPAKAASKE